MQARFRYLSFTAVLSSPNAFGIGLLSAGDSKVRCTWLSHYSAYIHFSAGACARSLRWISMKVIFFIGG